MLGIASFARTIARFVVGGVAVLASAVVAYADAPTVRVAAPAVALPTASPLGLPPVSQVSLSGADPYLDRTLRVRLRVRDGALRDRGSDSWTYTVDFTATPFDGAQRGPAQASSLTIRRTNDHDTFEAVAVLHDFPRNGAEIAVAQIVAPCAPGPPPCTSTLPSDIVLEAEMSAERAAVFDATRKPSIAVANAGGGVALAGLPDMAVSYEFEWVFFDRLETAPGDPFSARDPVRVPANDPQMKVDLSYPQGTLYVRGRAIGRFSTPNRDVARPGQWSNTVSFAISGAAALAPTFNWSYAASFAESRETVSSVSFFDGALSKRQSQFRLTSQDGRLIGETKYDREGRASIGFLPAPVADTVFGYAANFNAVARPGASPPTGGYDTSAFDGIVPPAAASASGAGQYYSAAAAIAAPYDRYVPDAGGYPFTFTRHARDSTGRLQSTSDAGAALRFRAGGGHSVLFGYGTAASTPLRQLFGRNVGRANYYERNTVIDANGQAHVAYVGRAGRSIATALAGDAPDGIESIRPSGQLVTYRLDDNNVVDAKAGVSRSVNRVSVEQVTNLFFRYDLNGVDYAVPASGRFPRLCADCQYRLRIRITGPDGNIVTLRSGATPQTDPDCDGGSELPAISQPIPAAPPNACTVANVSAPTAIRSPTPSEVRFCAKFGAKGEYEIVKELTVDRGGVDDAIARAEATPGYFQPADYRPAPVPAGSQVSVVALGGSLGVGACLADCNAYCSAAAPDDPADPAKRALHQDCVNTCTNPLNWAMQAVASSTCDSLKREIDADVAPGGYLGKAAGIPAASHPEYCHVKEPFANAGLLHSICGRTVSSDQFDYRMMRVATYDEALCRGYLDPPGGTPGAPPVPAGCLVERDPFFDATNIGTLMKAWVVQAMQDYATVPGFSAAWAAASPLQHPSIWQLAAMATGPTNAPIARDAQWRLFRSLYMGVKQMALARHLEDAGGGDYCPYWNDPHAHVKRPEAVGTIAQALANLQQTLTSYCASTCAGRAKQWVASLETACRTRLSTDFESYMKGQLQSYCTSKCETTNPVPMLTRSDIAFDAAHNGPLSKAGTYQPPPIRNCVQVPDGRGGTRQQCFTLQAQPETLPAGCTLDRIAQPDPPPGTAPGPFDFAHFPPLPGRDAVAYLTVKSSYQFRPPATNACTATGSAAVTDAAGELADQQGRIALQEALATFGRSAEQAHYGNCLGPELKESFGYQAVPGEYHFTLKYYDQAGNLVQTVPPAGVRPLNDSDANSLADGAQVVDPAHTLLSKYTYNSFGQVTAQETPDAGVKRSWYNRAGQIRLSQNAQQALDNRYAYVKYDRRARITETGLVTITPDANGVIAPFDAFDAVELGRHVEETDFPQPGVYPTQEVVTTTYDAYPAASCQGMTARQPETAWNLRGRIAAVLAATTIGSIATCYGYDPHGNITALSQDIPGLGAKTIAYDYDILDGKIRSVRYQPDQAPQPAQPPPAASPDRLEHRFTYDADRRLKTVETSRDGELWERDAAYSYYRHGPLARLELGADRVQGLDYTYTISGWPKGINADTLSLRRDPGGDGAAGANAVVARDVFGSAVHYFPGDYEPAGAAALAAGVPQARASRPTQDPAALASANCTSSAACGLHDLSVLLRLGCASAAATACGLYDGNVKANVSAVANAQGGAVLGAAHRYDQLYRLRETTTFGDLDAAANAWPPASSDPQLWRAQTSYDANGNITALKRCAPTPVVAPPPADFCTNGSGGASLMDDLTYNYPLDAANAITSNRLGYITDQTPASAYPGDLDSQPADNYGYDASGRLIRDRAAGLDSVAWNAASRVTTVARASDSIEFVYDGLGNRVAKIARPSPDPATWSYRYFVRDEKGRILATYRRDLAIAPGPPPALEEHTLFDGASRIGLWSAPQASAPSPQAFARVRGDKQYELANYLGNVEATIRDRKMPVVENGAITHYGAVPVNASGYYPFGMLMPGRTAQTQRYRFGYSGLERDDELKGAGNSYYTSARLFDPRVGRWLSPDPVDSASQSPFAGFGNNPARFSDASGAATDDETKLQEMAKNDPMLYRDPQSTVGGWGLDLSAPSSPLTAPEGKKADDHFFNQRFWEWSGKDLENAWNEYMKYADKLNVAKDRYWEQSRAFDEEWQRTHGSGWLRSSEEMTNFYAERKKAIGDEPSNFLWGVVCKYTRLPCSSKPEDVASALSTSPNPLRNAHLAGKVHPSGVRFKKTGHADFTGVAVVSVKIKQTGNRALDQRAANTAAKLEETPPGWTWHHVEDCITMQLVPTFIHEATGHTGGVAIPCH